MLCSFQYINVFLINLDLLFIIYIELVLLLQNKT